MFSPEADALRLRLLSPWNFRLYLLSKLPLALAAGLRLTRLDAQECVVALPGGWRTQNPFGSTYFAAQSMAAEMSTGAPAMILAMGAPVSLALILVELRATFSKRVVGPSFYACKDVAAMAEAVARAAAQDGPVTFAAESSARTSDGSLASTFQVVWSFKRRAPKT